MMLRSVVVTMFVLFNSHLQANEVNESFEKRVDNIFQDKFPTDSPGCSVGVFKDQSILFEKSYGLANLEHNVPLSAKSVHRLASVSKQFTAFSVLLLADEGKIDLEDDIRIYLPDLHDYGTKVSINSMLGHFSGMADYRDFEKLLPKPLLSSAGGPFRLGNQDYLTNNEYYDVIKTLPLFQPPNHAQRYSNFAFYLLSRLVEKVSGETLRQYADRRIFKPLGMKDTFYADNLEEIVPNRASGYGSSGEAQFVSRMTNNFTVGDGGLHTSIEDMVLWDAHFYTPKLGRAPKKLMNQMNTPNSQHGNDEDVRYKYANGQYTEGTVFEHSGGWLGTATAYLRRPNDKISVAVFCNLEGADSMVFAYEIAEIAKEIN